jgi:hypothetical protein
MKGERRNGHDKFQQPIDAIEIVSRAPGPRTILNAEAIQKGRDRIKAGEKLEDVALDLAFDEFVLRLSLFDIELTDAVVETGKQRIRAGDDPQAVALDLGAATSGVIPHVEALALKLQEE